MSYLMLRGVGQDEAGSAPYDPELDFCDPGQYFDITQSRCVCQAGLVPDMISGAGCVSPDKLFPEDVPPVTVPSLPTPSLPKVASPAPAPTPGQTPSVSHAKLWDSPWFIGGAVLLGVVAIGAVLSKTTATPNRRRRGRANPPPGPPKFGHERTPQEIRARIRWETWAAKLARRHGRNGDAIGHELTAARYEDKLDRMAIVALPNARNARTSKRPPKQWIQRCTRGVSTSRSVYSPQAVCGAQWYRKMSAAKKRAAKRRAYGR